jgi:hypothetical protein
MRKRLFLFILVAVMCVNESVDAQQLGTFTVWDSWGENSIGRSGVKVKFGWYTGQYPSWTQHPCFEWNFSTADVGKTFYLNSQTNSKFDEMVSILTNGVENKLYYMTSSLPSSPASNVWLKSESNFTKYGISGTDFYGCLIDSISFTLNSLQIRSPGSNPNNDGQWTDLYISGNIGINGVPEPCTLLLLGLGAAIVRKKRS